MADRNHLRLAGQADPSGDDPFAELTKIMGFDPRSSNRPAPAVPFSAAAASIPADDRVSEADLSIDLEKELLGAFADEPHSVAVHAAPIPAASPLPAPAAAAPVEQAPAASSPAVVDVVAAEPETMLANDGSEGDSAMAAAQMDAAPVVAAAVEAESPQVQASADEASPFAFFDEDLARALEAAVPADAPAVEAVALVAEDEQRAPDLEAQSAAPIAYSSDDAEIDRLFEQLNQPIALEPIVAPKHEPELAGLPFDSDLDHELDLGIDSEFDRAEPVAPVVPVVAAQSAANQNFITSDDPTLEDELNALLGNTLSARAAAPLAPPVAPVAAETAPQSRIFDFARSQPATHDEEPPADVAAIAEDQPADDARAFVDEPVSEPDPMVVQHLAVAEQVEPEVMVEPAVEDDFEFDAENFDWDVSTIEDAPAAAAEMVRFDFADDVPQAEAVAQTFAEELVAEDVAEEVVADAEAIDLDFDEHAFDAAISRSLAAETHEDTAGLAAAAPTEHADMEYEGMPSANDPYAALAALSATLKPARSWSRETPVAPLREAVAAAAARYAPEPAQPAWSAYNDDEPVTPAADEDFAGRSPSRSDRFEDEPQHYAPTPITAAPLADSRRHDDSTPDIGTLDVPEQAVALADDLDLPDFVYEDESAPAPTYDDIDAEFSSLLNEMNAADAEASPYAGARYDDGEPDYRAAQPAAYAPSPAASAYAVAAAAQAPASIAELRPSIDALNAAAPARAAEVAATDAMLEREFADMEFAYDPDLDEEMALPAFQTQPKRSGMGRGMMIAAVVGGVAVLGGIGALALSFGNVTGSSEPVLVKADQSPVKVKPENPGGTTVPNQDNKVYESVAGSGATAEAPQEKLVTTTEEPVEMPEQSAVPPLGETDPDIAPTDSMAAIIDNSAPEDAGAALPKAEDRVEQTAADNAGVDNSVEVAAVAPRKVRTMIVKADGTLVAREDPAPAAPAVEPTETAAAAAVDPAPSVASPATGAVPATDDLGSILPPEDQPQPAPAAEAQQPAPAAAAPAETASAEPAPALAPVAKAQPQSSDTPARVPVAPARPSDQPVDIVGEVKADQVAALTTTAAAPGSWAMQIASQPTEAAAQSSYKDLARRYASVLNGQQATIVKAEIAGKGTFWRVRVPASSRNEAISLCESYKSAGGNCFVSK